jgi:small multidrug resistance pump
MKWLFLSSALIFECIGFISLKYSQGFTKLFPSILTVVVDLLALLFFFFCLKRFETSFLYMIGAGVGTALIVAANALIFKQIPTTNQVICILLIILGTVGLQNQNTAH